MSESKANDLTADARNGYYGNPNPHIPTSPAWYAHALGRYLHATGRPVPAGVRMSRGYSIRVRDLLFKIHEATAGAVSFERII